MLVIAREASGLTQSELARIIGVSQATVSKLENGLEQPSGELLNSIAKQLSVPTALFSSTDEVVGEGIVDVFHRKRLTLPARALRKAHAQVNLRRMEIVRLMRGVELEDVAPLPALEVGEHGDAREVAGLVRAQWRVPAGPIHNLVELVEATATPVLIMDLGHEKLSAISVPGLNGRFIVFLNSRMSPSHLRFAMAHELGHLVMHQGSAFDQLETEADRFASELLMPRADIQPHLKGLRFSDLGMLKPVWKVSLAALTRTAFDLGELTERQYRYFNMKLNQLPGGRKNEPGEFKAEEPQLVKSLVDHHKTRLSYSDEELAKLMVTTESHLRRAYFEHPPRPLRIVGSND